MTNIFLEFEKQFSEISPSKFIGILAEEQFRQELIQNFNEFKDLKCHPMELHLVEPKESLDFPLRWQSMVLKSKANNSVKVFLHSIPNNSSSDWIYKHMRDESHTCLEAAADILMFVFQEPNKIIPTVKVVKHVGGSKGGELEISED
jgi:hypothetical protein